MQRVKKQDSKSKTVQERRRKILLRLSKKCSLHLTKEAEKLGISLEGHVQFLLELAVKSGNLDMYIARIKSDTPNSNRPFALSTSWDTTSKGYIV